MKTANDIFNLERENQLLQDAIAGYKNIIASQKEIIENKNDDIIASQQAIIEKQNEIIAGLSAEITELKTLVNHYVERFKMYQRRRYGTRSEISPDQLRIENIFDDVFNEAEEQADPELPEPTFETITYKRKKRAGKRKDDLDRLPVERIDYELPESERVCPECGETMHKMGEKIRDEIEIIPAQVIHKVHAAHTYGCRNCEQHGDHATIVNAELPAPLIEKSVASPSAVAHIIVQKYVNGVPLYRQEKLFAYDNVSLSRQTMANWVLECANRYLSGIYALMIYFLLQAKVIHADETSVQVLHEKDRAPQTKSYEWLYRTSGCSDKPIVIYEYKETRSQEHPKKFLADFKGYLHADGYQAYHTLPPDITVVGCWFHARQYWENYYTTIPENKREGSIAERGLVYINLLFVFEDEFRSLTPDERYEKRLLYSKQVSDDFFKWVTTLNAPPKSLLGQAIHYALSQRVYLENVYLDGRLELSNNRAERSIKPFVQGRKQWLFSNTPNGAEASSIIYSIIETAKENNLHPFHYIKYLLKVLPNAKTNELESFLPWSDSLPDCCRAPINATPFKPHFQKLPKGSLQLALLKLRQKYETAQDAACDPPSTQI